MSVKSDFESRIYNDGHMKAFGVVMFWNGFKWGFIAATVIAAITIYFI